MTEIALTSKTGSCHCGKVKFSAFVPDLITVHECNCSICNRVGFLHLIVPLKNFTLEKGAEDITTYTFNTRIAKHTFCRHCGVKPFYTPRSNPDGVSLNLRCMNRDDFASITIEPLDGQNWEQNAGKLAHLSQSDD